MALPDAVQNTLKPGLELTWTRTDGTAEDLTGATLSGVIRNMITGVSRAIAGTLSVSDASNGVFTWTFAAADVADAGLHQVQFSASFESGATPAKSYVTSWHIREALSVSA